ncbi:MAG: hypothetical protein IT380_06740 [Myxococcales bacterium]|nr:hypothetical protein [Myxococcales bacterium]
MSRAYRITVRESLSRHVQVEDGVCSSLELLPILQKDRMRELLAAELAGKGFERDGTSAKRSEGDGVTTKVDLETGEVSVTAEGHTNLSLQTERSAAVDSPTAEREKALRQVAQQALEREAKAEEETLRRQVTEKLEGKLRDLKDELDGVVNRVTANALKQRAAELGQVEEIHEEANGGLTIKVRV